MTEYKISPLSALLSEMYIYEYKTVGVINSVIYNLHFRAKFIGYVDNTLILIQGLIRQAENTIKYLNNINKQLQFILEMQINITLHFIDRTVKIVK